MLGDDFMDLETYVKDNLDAALNDLAGWIKINSVDDSNNALENKPFGEGVQQALHYIATLARNAGFEVDECDGYCTEIIYGAGDKLVSIYAHCDVVPATGNWLYPPYSATIKDGVMYGRGTSDDKGPAMAAFYALKYLKEYGDIHNCQIRLVIGGNEEKGSRCLEYYFDKLHKPYPDYGFTPDGDFPLIYGEKGISNYKSEASVNLKPLLSFHAGAVINSVPDRAEATLLKDETFEETLKKLDLPYEISMDDKEMHVVLFGKAAHGSLPKLGINAGLKLLSAIGEHYNLDFLKLICKNYSDPSGKSLDLFFETPLLHQSTYNVGIIDYNDQKFEMQVNFRYPENVKIKNVIISLNRRLPLQTTLMSESKCLLFDPKSPLVTTLLKAYQDTTKDYKSEIMTIGGGTYAKECRNTIAFGSAFPGRDDKIHDANESIHISDFAKSIEIYATAVCYLSKL